MEKKQQRISMTGTRYTVPPDRRPQNRFFQIHPCQSAGKALPADYGYIIEELITEKPEVLDKEAYYEAIIQTILEIGSAENFIIAVAELIQRLVVDHLHIIGDIFDRGRSRIKSWTA